MVSDELDNSFESGCDLYVYAGNAPNRATTTAGNRVGDVDTFMGGYGPLTIYSARDPAASRPPFAARAPLQGASTHHGALPAFDLPFQPSLEAAPPAGTAQCHAAWQGALAHGHAGSAPAADAASAAPAGGTWSVAGPHPISLDISFATDRLTPFIVNDLHADAQKCAQAEAEMRAASQNAAAAQRTLAKCRALCLCI